MATESALHIFNRPLEFRLATHSITGLPMVEIHGDGKFIGAIYQGPHGLRFISKYQVDVSVSQEGLTAVLLNYMAGQI